MTWQYVYRLMMMKARGVRTMVRGHCHTQDDLSAAKFPPSNSEETAIQAEIEAYQAIFASDLACNCDSAACPKADRENCNYKSSPW